MSELSVNKNDESWKSLFEKYNILDEIEKNEIFEISAQQINQFREARLMTKFDHKTNLPDLFKKNGLAILPISRGSYVISHLDAYKKIEAMETPVTRHRFPLEIESIDYENITSEAMAINCAYVSGIIGDFTGEDQIMPTVSGRMSSGSFGFSILNTKVSKSIDIKIENSQIEIDGGFEGTKSLAIIEAKNFISDDFLVRQLYYPYRLWETKVAKRVRPIFLIYSNGIFNLYEYTIFEKNNYNSIEFLRCKRYTLEEEKITTADIEKMLSEAELIEEPEIPFPQADNFERIINLIELLHNGGELSRDDITLNYGFDIRQTSYYADAGRYLGYILKEVREGEIFYSLTQKGEELFKMKILKRNLAVIKEILSHRPFNSVLKMSFMKGNMVSKDEICRIMKESKLYNIESDNTFQRRAVTVSKWVEWILEKRRN